MIAGDLRGLRVMILGSGGLVGSALTRRLALEEDVQLLTPPRSEIDLKHESRVLSYFRVTQPDIVVLAAARVGGISANLSDPLGFLLDNLTIQKSVMSAALAVPVQGLMFLGSSCIYPRDAQQPVSESSFMQGQLEPSNESYAIAKIAGIRLARILRDDYGIHIWLPMPSNVYGPDDHFDLDRAHVLSALITRFEAARMSGANSVTLWGTGRAMREFLHATDLAEACVTLMKNNGSLDLVNVGAGQDISIAGLATKIASIVGYEGAIAWDTGRPDGTPRKLLNIEKMRSLGWEPRVSLTEGIRTTVDAYRQRTQRSVRKSNETLQI